MNRILMAMVFILSIIFGSNLLIAASEIAKDDEKIIKKKWPKAIKTSSGLRYVVLKAGKVDKPKAGKKDKNKADKTDKPVAGDIVTAHYVGTLLNGQKFDSSVDRGTPLQFTVGVGQVIKGWDEALLDMKKGEKKGYLLFLQALVMERWGLLRLFLATLH